MTVKGNRKRQRLDRESSDDPLSFQGGADGLGNAEITESLGAADVRTVRARCIGAQGSRLQ
jgi:hypothetical protein